MSASRRSILALTATVAWLCPGALRAQELSGTWHAGPENVSVTVAEWGSSCGPRPVSRTSPGGREVTVRDDGNNLTLQGNRTNRTDRCWSDNRAVSIVSASHPSAHRWVVSCSTPESEALGEHGTYSLEASSNTHIRFRDETSYTWTIEGSHCRASSVLTREYDRAEASTAPAAAPHPEPPVHAPAPVAPAPSRCAHPGAAVAVVVSPSHRSVPAGARACFRARVVDGSHCELAGQTITWTQSAQSGAPDATMEGGCLIVPAGALSGAYELTATAGALRAQVTATVVSADAYRSLVAAHLEDPDAGADMPSPGATSGMQFGSSNVSLSRRTGGTTPPWPWLLLSGAGVLAAIALALALRKRTRSPVALDSEPPAPVPSVPVPPLSARPQGIRHNAIEMMDPAIAAPSIVAPAPPVAPGVPAAAAVPLSPPTPPPAEQPTRKCPSCGARYGSEMAFCPIDGTPLAGQDGGPVAVAVQVPVSAPAPPEEPLVENVCPRCHRRFAPPTQFCGEDGTPLQPVARK